MNLDDLKLTECEQSWDDMSGDDRRRLCFHCGQHVHDVAAMTRAEAEDLLADVTSQPCVMLHRRPDGTVVTADCETAIPPPPDHWRTLGVPATDSDPTDLPPPVR